MLGASFVDPHGRDHGGWTPLVQAVLNSYPLSLVRALAEAGADPHAEIYPDSDPWRVDSSPLTVLGWLAEPDPWSSDPGYRQKALTVLRGG